MNDLLKNYTKTALFQFYVGNSISKIKVEKVLSDSPSENNKILSNLIQKFHKIFEDNSSFTFEALSFRSPNLWRIEVCDEVGNVLTGIDNIYYYKQDWKEMLKKRGF